MYPRYLLFLLITAPLLIQGEARFNPKDDAWCFYGLKFSFENHIQPHEFIDTFKNDTRAVYAEQQMIELPKNEIGHIPLNARSGVYHNKKQQTMLLECGRNEKASIKLTLPHFKTFILNTGIILQSAFSHSASFAIELESSTGQMLKLRIPLAPQEEIEVDMIQAEKPFKLTTPGIGLYPRLPDGFAFDRYIFSPETRLALKIIRSAQGWQIFIDERMVFELPVLAPDFELLNIRLCANGVNTALDSIKAVSLGGMYVGPLEECSPLIGQAKLYMVMEGFDSPHVSWNARLVTSNARGDLLSPIWGAPTAEINTADADLTEYIRTEGFYRLRIDVNIDPAYFEQDPAPSLPVIKFVDVKTD